MKITQILPGDIIHLSIEPCTTQEQMHHLGKGLKSSLPHNTILITSAPPQILRPAPPLTLAEGEASVPAVAVPGEATPTPIDILPEGWNADLRLWIMEDCVFTADGDVILPDEHNTFSHQGTRYRIESTDLPAPQFFQSPDTTPQDLLSTLLDDPGADCNATRQIFSQLAKDLVATFGDSSGLLPLGTILSYPFAPELLARYNCHPGLWIHGRPFSGKTETAKLLMQIAGFPEDHRPFFLSGGSARTAIERTLAAYSNLPVHFDEFRNDALDPAHLDALRHPFNRQARQKGSLGDNPRVVQPMTSPLITGVDVPNDSATLSRYVVALLSQDKRHGTPAEQKARYSRMLRDSAHYHRISRWIYMNRPRLAADLAGRLDDFMESMATTIPSERVRLCYGIAYAAYATVAHALGAHCSDAYLRSFILGYLSKPKDPAPTPPLLAIETSLRAANVAEISSAEATKYLTANYKAFNHTQAAAPPSAPPATPPLLTWTPDPNNPDPEKWPDLLATSPRMPGITLFIIRRSKQGHNGDMTGAFIPDAVEREGFYRNAEINWLKSQAEDRFTAFLQAHSTSAVPDDSAALARYVEAILAAAKIGENSTHSSGEAAPPDLRP